MSFPVLPPKKKRKNLVNKKEEEEDSKKSSKHVEMKLLKKICMREISTIF
jgi:hypothetical protein